MFFLTDNINNIQPNGRPIYENASVDNRLPQQDVSSSQYQELVSGILIFV